MKGVHRLLNSKDKPIGKVVWKAGLEVLDLDGLSVVTMFKRIVCFGTECYTYKIGQCYTCSDTRRGYPYFADQGRFGNSGGYEIQTLLKCPSENATSGQWWEIEKKREVERREKKGKWVSFFLSLLTQLALVCRLHQQGRHHLCIEQSQQAYRSRRSRNPLATRRRHFFK